MERNDDTLFGYEVREVTAAFHDARRFEDAVDQLERNGVSRDAINMMASHDAVKSKLSGHFRKSNDIVANDSLPQPIFEDRRELRGDKRLAVGLPVYIGGMGAGLAVVATGGTIAFAALIAAAGATAGAGIGSLVAHAIGDHHAKLLARALEKGALVVTVEVKEQADEDKVIRMLQEAGGENVNAHSLTRYEFFDRVPLPQFNPYDWPGL